jgi:peptidoglycan/xylan/chitin deacetylase (PgdA/CDA1 family)
MVILFFCLVLLVPTLWVNGWMVRSVSQGEQVEKGSLFLTFDDAIDVNWRYALPILQEYGYPAIAFYSTRTIRFDLFNKYVAAGWEIGCHTYSHPDLNTLSKERLYQEIVQPKFDLETKIPNINKIVTFAYPYGEGWNNNTVLALVNQYYEKTRPLFENWYHERTFDVSYPEVALTNAQKALGFVMAGNDAWLMFHAISDTPTVYFTINTTTFRQVLNMIRISGIQPTTWTRLHKTTNVVTFVVKPFGLSLNYEFADQCTLTAPSKVSIWNEEWAFKEWEDSGSTDRTRTFNASSTVAIIYDPIDRSLLVP